MKILIGIPAYKRRNLLELHLKYTSQVLKANLTKAGFTADILVVGSTPEEMNVVNQVSPDQNIQYKQLPNFLSNKKNEILKTAKEQDYDFLVWLDSDDFLPTNLLAELLVKAKRNGFWASVSNIYFLSAFDHSLYFFEGYKQTHDLANQGLGTARVFTKKLIQLLPNDVFGIDRERSMDVKITPYLKALNISPEKRLIRSEYHNTILGIKTSQNIWSIEDYQKDSFKMLYTLESDLFEWLPDDIKKGILNLDPSKP